ncbi:MAG: LuxR C-terminal-related transcriptional regulator [Spirochaetales bacterium]|uniref:LuxR C-terminal-related transcriptional regulator n=1 Tax=Candidatus Thalassospirochaeta sargassi TaxID=3119039 RepID=A0AAJ1IEQ6_9SPIO|nr:LuxR C-terminal-related transcriptional regulator [Spirochaetales bacterium]
MIVFSALCMISALIAFEGSIAVLRLNRRRLINIIYSIFALDYMLVCLFFNQYVTSPDHDTALFWNRMLVFPASFYPSIMLHFAMILISKNERLMYNWLIPFIYLPSFLIGLVAVLGKSIQDVFHTPWGWENYSSPSNFWLNISFVVFILLCVGSFMLVLYRYKKPFSERKKKQLRPIMYSQLIGTIGWVLSLGLYYTGSGVLQSLVSNLAFLIIVTPLLIGVRVAIFKYHLMVLAPDRYAAELISGIDEPVFLLDMQGEVMFQNPCAGRLAKYAEIKEPYSICSLFHCGERMQKELEDMVHGNNTGSALHVTIKCLEKPRSSYVLQIQGVKNEIDEYIGAVCVATKEQTLEGFQERFGITPRETDVLYLSVAGFTNKEIARELNISIRTVEHHHENIYNKLGINNKLELHNISLKYRIISGKD